MSRSEFERRIDRLTAGFGQQLGGLETDDRISTLREVIEAERMALQHLRTMRAQPKDVRTRNLGTTRVFDDMALDLRIREADQRIRDMCRELSEIT